MLAKRRALCYILMLNTVSEEPKNQLHQRKNAENNLKINNDLNRAKELNSVY